MPKKVNTRKAASSVRSNSQRRKNKKKPGRKGTRRPTPAAPSVIADSFFALTLPKLQGYDVEVKKETLKNGMLSELEKIYRQIDGIRPLSLRPNFTYGERVNQITKRIVAHFPEQFDVNLSDGEGGLQLEIFFACNYHQYLPAFAVGEPLLKLKKDYPKLHDLFVIFIASYLKFTKMEWWGYGLFDEALERCEEEMEWNAVKMEPDWVESLKSDIEMYRRGEARNYAKLIRETRMHKPDEILKSLSRLKRKHPITGIIKDGCEFMKEGYDMFSYHDEKYANENFGDYYLRFDSQAVILWTFNGAVNAEYDQWIESEANEGGQAEPIAIHFITPKGNNRFVMREFEERAAWPYKMGTYMTNAQIKLSNYIK